MAREILFKAKRKDNGEWVEGYYQKRYDEIGRERHFIFWCKSNIVWEYVEIDINTLCQYTGKKINRKKCFEGDVIFARRSLLYVGWDDVFLMWMTYYFDDVGNQITFCPLCDIADWETEDIRGNIFDNPELLGGE